MFLVPVDYETFSFCGEEAAILAEDSTALNLSAAAAAYMHICFHGVGICTHVDKETWIVKTDREKDRQTESCTDRKTDRRNDEKIDR